MLFKLFYTKLLTNPFKCYCRVASCTFGLVGFTNLTTTLVGYGDPSHYRRDLIKYNPDIYFIGLLAKCFYYGSLWPSYYLTIFQKPKNAFVLAPHIITRKYQIKDEE